MLSVGFQQLLGSACCCLMVGRVIGGDSFYVRLELLVFRSLVLARSLYKLGHSVLLVGSRSDNSPTWILILRTLLTVRDQDDWLNKKDITT